jgi:hypothetical protein
MVSLEFFIDVILRAALWPGTQSSATWYAVGSVMSVYDAFFIFFSNGSFMFMAGHSVLRQRWANLLLRTPYRLFLPQRRAVRSIYNHKPRAVTFICCPGLRRWIRSWG